MSAIGFQLPEDVVAVRDGVLRFVEAEVLPQRRVRLRVEARGCRLRIGQADVAHHRNAAPDQEPDDGR